MGTKIEYVRGKVLEVTGGCTECSVGCENCWARKEVWRMAHNPLLGDKWKGLVKKTPGGLRWTGKIKLFEDALEILLKRKKPTTYFVDSKADLFHKDVPFEYIDKVYAVASMCPQHTLLLLTKRIEIAAQYYDQNVNDMAGHIHWVANQIHDWHGDEIWPLPNIHLGVTICNQDEADEKLPIALQIPGFDWVSAEPLLGEIDFEYIKDYTMPNKFTSYDRIYSLSGEKSILGHRMSCNKIKRVVVGCESGPKRRPCKLEYIRSIVQQCKAAGVGCYVKQVPMPWCGKEYRGQWAGMPTIEELDETNKMKNYVSHDPAEWPEDLQVRDEI